jgi:undecaprenyl-diphosphatase
MAPILRSCVAAIAAMMASSCYAGCFWSRIDHEASYSDSGAWKASGYRTLSNALTAANLAGALWEGTESRAGRTMWEAAESQVLTEAIAIPVKPVFGRLRPIQAHDPCRWGEHGQGHSFPSEEAGVAAALVTPWVLEYGRSDPATYALLLLPAYVGAGRIRNQAHWPSDVVAGWAIGAGLGWWEHARHRPLVLAVFPGGAFLGFHRNF